MPRSTDSSTWCWGHNYYGQLGNGTTLSSPTPHFLPLVGVSGLSSGLYHSCAVIIDHSVRCWGQNLYGQVGNGQRTGVLQPSTVGGLTLGGPSTGDFVSLVPGRLVDTRAGGSTSDGLWASVGACGAAGSVSAVQVAGRAGVLADADSVVLNVTAVGPRGDGYLTVWPCGAVQPNASNLNFVRGQTIPNAVVSKLGTGGSVCVFTSAATDLLVDVNATFPAATSFESIVPARLADTRNGGNTVDRVLAGGGAVIGGSVLEVLVAGRGGVPANADSAVLNVTVAAAQGDGYLTVWPCGSPQPNASNLNYLRGQTIPNAVFSKLGTAGKVCIFAFATTDILVDVNGAFPSGSSFTSLVPAAFGRYTPRWFHG